MPDNITSLLDLNQTNSTNTLAIIPVSGLTYTLFGLTCLFTCLGLAGNFSILTISLKYRRRAKSHDVLITALAVTDSFATVTFALMQPCVYGTIGMDVRALTTIGCKVFMSVLLSAMFCSSTVVVLVSIERFVAVWYPIRSRNFLSRQTALRSVWLCVAPIVIISTTLSILYCEIDTNGVCDPNHLGHEYSSVLKRMPDPIVYKIMGIVLSSPQLILLILTPMTVVKLCKQMTIRSQLTSQEVSNKELQISMKLIMVVVVHVTLIAVPIAIALYHVSISIPLEGNVLSGITLTLLLNHSTNFLLYNIFDREFRRRLYVLFGFDKAVRVKNYNINEKYELSDRTIQLPHCGKLPA